MDVQHIASLARLTLSPDQISKITPQLTQTLASVEIINQLDTSRTSATSQVTGLKNITRPDRIDVSRILPVSVVLSAAPATYHDFIVVDSVL